MFPKIEPAHKIPKEYREEYKTRVAACVRARVFAFCISMSAIFVIVFFAGLVFSPEMPLAHRLKMFSILAAGTTLILFMNRNPECGKCIIRSKINALLLILLAITISHFALKAIPGDFSYGHFLLMLFFALVMIPWSMAETLGIIALLFGAFYFYASARDLSAIAFPPTLFGRDPMVNGFAHMTIAALMCLIIRYKDNERDVHNFLLLKDVEQRKEQMEKELEFASRVHRTLIPQSVSTSEAEVVVTYQPVATIGGDYAKFHFLGDDQLIFFICDVTGHGIPAALMVNRLHAEFNALVREIREPGQILRQLNRFIVRDFEGTSMYLSAVCGKIDFKGQKIQYSNYGHPAQYVYRVSDTNLISLTPHTTLLGIDDSAETTLHQGEFDYRKGDRVVLFTDGVLEIRNQAGEEFGSERMERFIRGHSNLEITRFNQELLSEISRFSTSHFRDDIFILSIQTYAKKASPVGV